MSPRTYWAIESGILSFTQLLIWLTWIEKDPRSLELLSAFEECRESGDLERFYLISGFPGTLEAVISSVLGYLLRNHADWRFSKSSKIGSCWVTSCCPKVEQILSQWERKGLNRRLSEITLNCEANRDVLHPGVSLEDKVKSLVENSDLLEVVESIRMFFPDTYADKVCESTTFFL